MKNIFGKILLVSAILASFTALIFSLVAIGMAGTLLHSDRSQVYTEKKAHLSLVRLEGPIFEPDKILSILQKIQENESCKGLLLRINSPGGAAAAAQEILYSLDTIGHRIPVVVSMGNIAASGGYYVALAAKKIFANPATLTGSIGVIAQFPHGRELLDKIGIDMEVIKSGKMKDAGSFYRKPSPEEREYFQGVIDDTYDQFLQDVMKKRVMELKKLTVNADGRVLTGRQALEIGLVDSLGGLLEAQRYLEKETGMKNAHWAQPQETPKWIEDLLGSLSSPAARLQRFAEEKLQAGVFYLWPVQ